jgi:hypothetical protein
MSNKKSEPRLISDSVMKAARDNANSKLQRLGSLTKDVEQLKSKIAATSSSDVPFSDFDVKVLQNKLDALEERLSKVNDKYIVAQKTLDSHKAHNEAVRKSRETN